MGLQQLLSTADLRDFLAIAPIACHEINACGEIVFVNAAECRLFGLPDEMMLGRPVWEFVAPEARESSRLAVSLKLAGKQPLMRFERDYIRADGKRLTLEIHEALIPDETSSGMGMRSFLIDVTQRTRAEQALQESERRYRHIVENASDIIYRTDINGRFVMFNPVATKLLGYPPEHLRGRSYLELIRPDYRSAMHRFYREQFTSRQSGTYLEFPAIAADGTELWFGQNVQLIVEHDRVTGFQAIARDITQQHRLEEWQKHNREELERRVKERTAELERANELLRREMEEHQRAEEERRKLEVQIQHAQRLESLGVLAGGIAHDFNNLLTAIMGYAGMTMREMPEGSRARASMEQVITAAQTAAELTQQMLAYAGRGRFVIEPIDVSSLIEDVSRFVTTLISRKARLRLNLAKDLPAIHGDSAQLRQVLVNLLTNASDALGERRGTIRISTGMVDAREGQLPAIVPDGVLPAGRYVFIEVADTGCGMSKETLARIFDPFFTTKFTGRGLGLAAVLGIVRSHKGTLEVQSEPGRGTTFRALFPTAETPAAGTGGAQGAAESEWRAEGIVLLVEGDPALRDLASGILRSAGLTVLAAADGYEAVRQFKEHADEIRAVLLDITLPGMNGVDVLRSMIQEKPEIKVVLCSGYDMHDTMLRLGPYSITAFLKKPYAPADLIGSLRAVL